MRVFVLPILAFLLVACAGMPEEGSSAPTHKTYPPSPSSENVDAYGGAKDPEINGCMSSLDTRRGFAETLTGPSAVKENRSNDFKLCWCKVNGFRGLRTDGSCLP